MKNSIIVLEENTAIIYDGYLKKEHFEEITNKIENVQTKNKTKWLKDFLEEKGYYVYNICHNAKLFSFSCTHSIMV